MPPAPTRRAQVSQQRQVMRLQRAARTEHHSPPRRRASSPTHPPVARPFPRGSGDPPRDPEHADRADPPPQNNAPPCPPSSLGRHTWSALAPRSSRAQPCCTSCRNTDDPADNYRSARRTFRTARTGGRRARELRDRLGKPPDGRADEDSTPRPTRTTISPRQSGATRWAARLSALFRAARLFCSLSTSLPRALLPEKFSAASRQSGQHQPARLRRVRRFLAARRWGLTSPRPPVPPVRRAQQRARQPGGRGDGQGTF